jgi:hypothetical protein
MFKYIAAGGRVRLALRLLAPTEGRGTLLVNSLNLSDFVATK